MDAALRVLADLAEDGRLTPSEGVPALAALLSAQRPSGAISEDVCVHAMATWALAEAAAARGTEPWFRQAAAKATEYLVQLHGPKGWPARPGGEPDAEATRWARLVLRGLSPGTLAAVAVPEGQASSLYTRLRHAMAGSKPSDARVSSGGASALERLLASLGRGHLKTLRP